MRWYEWLIAGLIASVALALFLAVLADHAIGQSLRDIVVESENGAIPPQPEFQQRSPATPDVALPWQTFEEVRSDFVGDMQTPVCEDIPDSYLSFVIHGGVQWVWLWGNTKFALVQFGDNHRPTRIVYEGRVVAGRLVVTKTTPVEQITKDSTPCTWFRATET